MSCIAHMLTRIKLATACLQVVMVNSSWTKAHIERLWWKLDGIRLVHPPCNTSSLSALPLDRKLKSLYLVSLAQFRPEKNHAKQLRAFALARKQAAESWTSGSEAILAARLKLIGSCRDQDDQARVTQLVSGSDNHPCLPAIATKSKSYIHHVA